MIDIGNYMDDSSTPSDLCACGHERAAHVTNGECCAVDCQCSHYHIAPDPTIRQDPEVKPEQVSSYLNARGVAPRKPGSPLPEEIISRLRGYPPASLSVDVENGLVTALSDYCKADKPMSNGIRRILRQRLAALVPAQPVVTDGKIPTCIHCGQPMSLNSHPRAGKPDSFLEVGVPYECIPCLVGNRHRWAERAMKAEGAVEKFKAQPAGITAEKLEALLDELARDLKGFYLASDKSDSYRQYRRIISRHCGIILSSPFLCSKGLELPNVEEIRLFIKHAQQYPEYDDEKTLPTDLHEWLVSRMGQPVHGITEDELYEMLKGRVLDFAEARKVSREIKAKIDQTGEER